MGECVVLMDLASLKNKIKKLPARTKVVVSIDGKIHDVVECAYYREKGAEFDVLVLCFLPTV